MWKINSDNNKNGYASLRKKLKTVPRRECFSHTDDPETQVSTVRVERKTGLTWGNVQPDQD